MNLKQNYERFFGKIETKEQNSVKPLTESQKKKFVNLSRELARKYPNAPMTIKEGYVWIGSKKIEPASEYLNRPSLQIQEQVRSFSGSGKKGLL